MAYSYVPEPSIRPAFMFTASVDGTALREAIKGFATDGETIIEILTQRSNKQRQEIAKFYIEEYGRSLINDLKDNLRGDFEDVMVALIHPPVDFLCKQLHKAMKGMGTNERALIEILCSRESREILEIVEAYERLYNRPLAEHLCSETSGDFRRLLTLITTGVRKDPTDVKPEAAHELAERLYNAGEGKWGTDEEVFNRIFAHESFPQLELVFDDYKTIGGRTIEQAIKSEMSGDLRRAMLAIVSCVKSPVTFFTNCLHKAMAGAGTDNTTLIRILVSRSEIDLANIREEYERIYKKTLQDAVEKETSGNYRKALLAIIGQY